MFALAFPLLSLPLPLAYLWKFATGALLCLVAQKRPKRWSGGALTVLLFYAFCFCFAGGIIAVFELFALPYAMAEGGGVVTQVPVGALLLALVVFVALCKIGISCLYKRKKAHACVYACDVVAGGRTLRVDGFGDTGNTAFYQNAPVCFLSVELCYDLYEMKPPDAWMEITTMAGKKRVALYRAERFNVHSGKRVLAVGEAYLSPSVQMRGRAYQMLFPASVLEEREEKKE